MARLSKEQWGEARKLWEGDESVSFQQLAVIFGCSRPAVGQKAEKEGWVRGGGAGTTAPPPQVEKAPKQPKEAKVSPPPKVSAKPTSKVSPQVNDSPATEGVPSRMSAANWQLVTGKRPVGRPTDYRDEFVDELVAYFDIPVQSEVDVDVVGKDGKTATEKRIITNTFPTLTRFAAKIGVTRQTLHDWATDKDADGALKRPEFSYAYARARDSQESLLTEGGMAGNYEPRFAVFAAKNLIGWKDQTETKSEVTLSTISTDQLDDAYKLGMEQSARDRAMVLERRAKRDALTIGAQK